MAQKAEASKVQRERPAQFGGPRLKLSVAQQIEGYTLTWVNDENSAVEALLEEGFTIVQKSEIGGTSRRLATAAADDTTTDELVSKHVGTTDDNQPLRAFLMKCPNDLWEERQQMRLNQADAWEEGIAQQQKSPEPGRYRPNA